MANVFPIAPRPAPDFTAIRAALTTVGNQLASFRSLPGVDTDPASINIIAQLNATVQSHIARVANIEFRGGGALPYAEVAALVKELTSQLVDLIYELVMLVTHIEGLGGFHESDLANQADAIHRHRFITSARYHLAAYHRY